MTRAERIHRGFHRVGIVIGLIVAALGLLLIFVLAGEGSGVAENKLPITLSFLGIVLVTYLLCRAFGWIIAGFAGE